MTTTRKLILGFGILTTLLIVSVAAIYLRVQAIDNNVKGVAEFARPRSIVTSELETNVAEFALGVLTYMQTDAQSSKDDAVKVAADIEQNFADYDRLIKSDYQRETAGVARKSWDALSTLGKSLLESKERPIKPEVSRELMLKRDDLQAQIEALQKDAATHYDTRRLQVRSDIQAVVVFALILLVAGVIVSLITSLVVGSGIVRSESELEERERQFRTLAESIPHLAWMAQPDGHIFWYNQRWFDYTGTTLQQMEGWGWQAVHDPNELPKVLERWQASIATGNPFDMIFPLKGKDGNFRHFLTRIVPVKDASGKVVRWFGTNTDITDAKRTEAELHEARSRLESMLAVGEIGTWEFDLIRKSVLPDRNLARMLNLPPGEISSAEPNPFTQAFHPDDRERIRDVTTRAIQSGGSYEIKYRIVTPQGAVRWMMARGRVERDPNGVAIRLPGIVIDVTPQHLADERFADQSRQFDLMLSSISDFAYTFDVKGRFTYVNKALLDLWGLKLEQAVGKNFFDLKYPDELAAKLQRQILDVVTHGQRIVDETPYTSPSGKAGYYQYIFSPVTDAAGKVVAVAGSTRDITSQKDIEQALRASEEQLQEADRRKNEFLATLAHELRNPLAPIRNGIHILKMEPRDSAASEKILPMMERQLTHMVRLVDDLLDVSRITRGRLELRKSRIELSTVVNAAVEASKPLIVAGGHHLEVLVPPESIYLDADLTRLAQVFSNLLNNAAKYTEHGGRIVLTVERHELAISVSIKDNGVGIPPAMLPKVFDMFTQVDRTLERAQGGLGIGLTLVRRLVELHGGTVEARSGGTGLGSEFIVHLPVLEQAAAPQADPATAHSSGLRRAAAGRRILVVDDNVDSAETLSVMLSMMGNDVRVCHDGLKGIEAARLSMPDVMLLDIGLPTLSGYEVCRRVRQLPGGDKPAIIACTGWGQEEDRRQSREAGFTAHIVKPVDPADLEKLIAALPRQDAVLPN